MSRLHDLQEENNLQALFMDQHRAHFDKMRTRHEDGTAPQAVASFNLFQTPQGLAQRMVDLADIQAGESVLEPSAGLGRIAREIRKDSKLTLCEQSADCFAHLFKEFPAARFWQGDFLEREPELFDKVLMNPPFKMRRDLKHIEHALKFVNQGGRLVGLCMAGPIREKALRDLCDTWEEIPAGAFKSEGTGVPTILFSIRK